MDRDTRELALALVGVAVFVVGAFALVDLLLYQTVPALRSVPAVSIVVPNLVVGGYALIEVGRHVSTAGGTADSPYFGDRLSLVSGGNPTAVQPAPSNATGVWFGVFWLGIAGQVVWLGLAVGGVLEGVTRQGLRLLSLLVVVVGAHFDMESLGRRVSWPGPQRWRYTLLVVPLNLVVAAVYTWLRRKRLREADGGGATPAPDASGPVPAWHRPGWHYLVAASLVGLVPVLTLRSVTVGTGGLVGAGVVVAYLGLPLGIYLDNRALRASAWSPRRRYWLFGALLPGGNLVTGTAYLLRRYETTRAD